MVPTKRFRVLTASLAAVLVTVLSTTPASAVPTTKSPEVGPGQEPTKVVPTAYALDINCPAGHDIEKPTYNLTGIISIRVTCRVPTDTVHLSIGPQVHVHNNALLASTLTGDQPMEVVRYPPGQPWITLKLPKTLKADHAYRFKLNFTRLVVTENTVNSNYYVGLLIEPGRAVEYFPVFNDSAYKVPFSINVTHHTGYVCLAASAHAEPRTPSSLAEDQEISAFQTTQPINIHMLSLFVGNFTNVNTSSITRKADENVDKAYPAGWKDVTIRMWSRLGFKEALELAAEMVPEAVCYVQCYLDVPFPNNRLDVLALPYYSGSPQVATSLAIFKESDLQRDPNYHGMMLRLSRAVAEQYLGVQVTPLDDARALNAALVSYLAAEAVRELKCRQHEDDRADLLANAVYSVYYELGSQFPLSGITSPQRPTLTGTKTELVLRMLAITLGDKTFKGALKNLINEKKERFYEAADLWGQLTQHALASETLPKGQDVATIANSWIDKDRFPLLTVTRNPRENSARLDQSVFRRRNYTPEERDLDKENSMTWVIPIVTMTEGQKFSRAEQLPRLWMSERTAVLDNCSLADSYLVVNPEETAPCIVNYDKRNWELLSNALNDRVEPMLPPRTRAKLLHDAVMLAHAGVLPFGDALPLLRSLEKETSPAVWLPVGNVLDHVRRDVEGTRLEDRFTAFLESILRAALRNVKEQISQKGEANKGKEGDESCDCEMRQLNETRGLILQQLARADMQPCITRAREMYKLWAGAEDPDRGTPVADSLMCCLFQWGEPAEFEFGVQRLVNFPSSRQRAERAFLLRALAGCPRQPERKLRIMNITLLENNGTFSEEDQRLVLQMVSARSHDLLKFMDDNWDVLKIRFESQPFMWEHLVSRATGSIKTNADLELLRKMYERRTGAWGFAESIVQQSIKKAQANVAWADEAFPSMEAWLDKYLVNHRKD